MKIAYQGLHGCYSEQAIYTFFGNKAEAIPMPSFIDIFESLMSDKYQLGLIPIENCLGGSIHENYDMLSKYDVIIQAEYNLKISHCLVALPGRSIDDIKVVVSHSQALQQCKSNCEKLNLTTKSLYDTAGSAKYIKDNNLKDTAAIASRMAAKCYDLDVLMETFQDSDNCYTRFLLIRKTPSDLLENTHPNQVNLIRQMGLNSYMNLDYKSLPEIIKTSIVITLNDSVGALVKILNIFSLYEINLTKLESRPIVDKVPNNSKDPFQYRFYLDFLIPYSRLSELDRIYNILGDHINYLKILGSYAQNNTITKPNTRLNIGIIGFSRFGQFLAKKLKQTHNVFVTSRSDYSEIADDMGVTYYPTLDELVTTNLDVIVISVSISSFKQVLENLIGKKPENCLIVDVLSVKDHPKQVMKQLVPSNYDILATHPMFGPDSCPTNDWSDQTFVYEPVRITDYERYDSFMETFSSCNLIEMDCCQHDILASKSQFITHLIGQLLVLHDLENTKIDTKSYGLLLKIKQIVANDSQDLFKGLYQFNSFTRQQLTKLVGNIEKLQEMLDK